MFTMFLKPTLSNLARAALAAGLAVVALAACGTDREGAVPAAQPATTSPAVVPTAPLLTRPATVPATSAPTQAPTAPAPTATRTAVPAPTPTATRPAVPAPTPAATPTAALPAVSGCVITDAATGWPREVDSGVGQGKVVIKAAPQRVHTLSLGHDEIIVALIGAKRLAGIGSFSADPVYSNVAGEVKDLPKVRREPEAILGLNPDLVIASKFTSQDLLDRISGAGVPVVKTSLESSAQGNIPNILLLGCMLGADGRAQSLAADVKQRTVFVAVWVQERVPANLRVSALSIARFADAIDAAGKGSTEGGIIEAAGGVDAAGVAGIEGHKPVSLESIAAMRPDFIILTQPEESGAKFLDELYAAPALADVPAVKNKRIVIGDSRYYTTLSHWNVRGIEESARLFYPEVFKDVTFKDFEPFKE